MPFFNWLATAWLASASLAECIGLSACELTWLFSYCSTAKEWGWSHVETWWKRRHWKVTTLPTEVSSAEFLGYLSPQYSAKTCNFMPGYSGEAVIGHQDGSDELVPQQLLATIIRSLLSFCTICWSFALECRSCRSTFFLHWGSLSQRKAETRLNLQKVGIYEIYSHLRGFRSEWPYIRILKNLTYFWWQALHSSLLQMSTNVVVHGGWGIFQLLAASPSSKPTDDNIRHFDLELIFWYAAMKRCLLNSLVHEHPRRASALRDYFGPQARLSNAVVSLEP